LTNEKFLARFAVELWAVPDFYRGAFGKIRLWRECGMRLSGRRELPIYLNVDLSLATWLAVCLRLHGAKNIFVHSHAAQFASPQSPWLQFLFRRLIVSCARQKIGVSVAAAEAMFGKSSNALLLPALIDFHQLRSEVRTSDIARSPTFTFGCVGRLDLQKNQGLLIHALAKLRDSGRLAKLLIIGDGEYGVELARLVDELQLQEQVSLLPARPDISVVYAHLIDAVLVPSVREGQCRVVAEAQFFGLPVAASVGVPDSAFLMPNMALRQIALTVDAWVEAMVSILQGTPQRFEPQLALAEQSELSLSCGVERLLRALPI